MISKQLKIKKRKSWKTFKYLACYDEFLIVSKFLYNKYDNTGSEKVEAIFQLTVKMKKKYIAKFFLDIHVLYLNLKFLRFQTSL